MSGKASYAAFLRGMNVGGHRLTNAELERHFASIGFREISTFRASGNVVFAAEERAPQDVTEAIEAGLEAALGYAVPSFLRGAGQLLEIAASEPFSADELQASGGKMQVSLLARPPSAATRRACSRWRAGRTGSRSAPVSSTGCRAEASASHSST